MLVVPSRRDVRHWAEACGVYLAWGLFASLPLDWASASGGWLGRSIGPHLKVSRKARRNLHRAFPEKNDSEIEVILLQVWDNVGRVVTEFPHLKQIAAERLEIIGGQHVSALRDDGLPGFLVSAHFGGWELSGPVAFRLGLPVHVVYRAANNPWVERLFRKGRGVAAESFIPKGAEGGRKLVAVMRRGGHLGMLVDQKMNDGISVPFMGRDAMTAPAVARLAIKFGCPIVAGRIERLGGAHFRVTLEEPIAISVSGDPQKDVYDVMARINSTVERWIRAQPGQWLWLHNRWPD
ncbi:lauroyl acyltransferase [Telmatospirillum sp.]|uniref:lysophospholipid acyltransferase family protein n=1 Tax=Telmatospirillum sp. TaxID=2079197 RepID=UPI0028512ACE|nr:lauroyl acyltransferase [Telmatospirillum sp.]MDR3436959.1 lauroyl acyltransferase [Telmatospirillum sp.]